MLQCLGAGKKAAQVEHAPIGAEPYVDTLVQVFFGFPEHHAEEDCEQSRRQHTALLYAVPDGERVGELAVVPHLSLLANVELLQDGKELRRTPELAENPPQTLSADSIERLRQVHEGCVQSHILFSALLLDLTKVEDHVCSSAVGTKSALAFWEDLFCDGWYQSV